MKKALLIIAMLIPILASCTKPAAEYRDSIEPFDTHPYWGPDDDHFFD